MTWHVRLLLAGCNPHRLAALVCDCHERGEQFPRACFGTLRRVAANKCYEGHIAEKRGARCTGSAARRAVPRGGQCRAEGSAARRAEGSWIDIQPAVRRSTMRAAGAIPARLIVPDGSLFYYFATAGNR